jgi:hypothetical protein
MTEDQIQTINNWIAELQELPCFIAGVGGSLAGMVKLSTIDSWRKAQGTALLIQWHKAGAKKQPGIDVKKWAHFLGACLKGRLHLDGGFVCCDGELATIDPIENLEEVVAEAHKARDNERAKLTQYPQLSGSLASYERIWAEGSEALQMRLKNRAAGLPDEAIPFKRSSAEGLRG